MRATRASAQTPARPVGRARALTPRAAGVYDRAGVLTLQRQAGNRATSSLLLQRLAEAAPAGWSRTDLTAMQRQLARLGVYTRRIDGVFGAGTRAALVEAFGDESWTGMGPEACVARLQAAPATKGTRGEHRFRYGELFRDGLLDVTVGFGYTEETDKDTHASLAQQSLLHVEGALTARKFSADAATGTSLLQAAHRHAAPGAFGQLYVKQKAATYVPPAGAARDVNAVVRLISNLDGAHGAEAASAMAEGMGESGLSMYMGHGRYGTGPDFDGIFNTAVVVDGTGAEVFRTDKEHALEAELKAEGQPAGRDAWAQFQHLRRLGRITITPSQQGNLLMNRRAGGAHRLDFGGRLLEWLIQQFGGADATGAHGTLARRPADPGRRYRVVLFDGCNTNQYETSLRRTPGYGTESTEVLSTRRAVALREEAAAAVDLLDSVLGQQSAEQAVQAMNRDLAEHFGGETGNAVVDSRSSLDPLVH